MYPEELKNKAMKLSMKIISHARRSYKGKLRDCLEEGKNPFEKFKDLKEEDWIEFASKCNTNQFAQESEYMKWLRAQNELNHHLGPTGYIGKQCQ